jgi:hypothetical protein
MEAPSDALEVRVALSDRLSARPTCSDSEVRGSHLESLFNVESSNVYWINLRANGMDWTPSEPVAIPYHHALRFEFENQAQFPALPVAPEQALRATFQITAQDIQPVPGRHEWRHTVRARLLDVCPLPK